MSNRRAKTWVEGAPTTAEQREENARFLQIDAAFRAGELDALREAVRGAEGWIEGVLPPAIGPALEYAIYHSPLAFIATLLDLGANPTPEDHTGFPPLIAALCCVNERPGAKSRPDVLEVLELLLRHGADPSQRGVNDYTALHMAVVEGSPGAVELLLRYGADPTLRTRIDEAETPREMAEGAGFIEIAQILARSESRGAP